MPKRKATDNGQAGKRPTGRRGKEPRRLGKRRAALEARISATDELIARRGAQLEAANARRATLAARLAQLDGGRRPAGATVAVPAVEAFCLREKVRVTVLDPRPTVLANGRRALTGTCASCGAKVVRMVSGTDRPAATSPATS